MDQPEDQPDGFTRALARRVRQIREGMPGGKWSAEDLARRVTDLGVPMTREQITKLETGRRQAITVEQAAALALALGVSPTNLLLPEDESEYVQVVPVLALPAEWVREWMYGRQPLLVDASAGDDHFFRHAPEGERRARRALGHPAVRAVHMLLAYAEDAVLPRSAETAGGSSPRETAQALRVELESVRRYVELLAEELEREAEKRPPKELLGEGD